MLKTQGSMNIFQGVTEGYEVHPATHLVPALMELGWIQILNTVLNSA